MNMLVSTIVLYLCGLSLGAAFAVIVYRLFSAPEMTRKRILAILYVTILFLLVNGAPFFLNSVIQPTDAAVKHMFRFLCHDRRASMNMLGIGLSYIITLLVCLGNDRRSVKLKRCLLPMLFLFVAWSAAAIWFTLPHILS